MWLKAFCKILTVRNWISLDNIEIKPAEEPMPPIFRPQFLSLPLTWCLCLVGTPEVHFLYQWCFPMFLYTEKPSAVHPRPVKQLETTLPVMKNYAHLKHHLFDNQWTDIHGASMSAHLWVIIFFYNILTLKCLTLWMVVALVGNIQPFNISEFFNSLYPKFLNIWK